MRMLSVIVLTLLTSWSWAGDAENGNPLLSEFNKPMMLSRLTKDDVTQSAAIAIETAKSALTVLYAIPANQRTYANTMLTYDDISNDVGKVHYNIYLMNTTHPDKEIRDECQKQLQTLNQFLTDVGLDENLYRSVKDFAATKEAKQLKGFQKLYLDDMLRGFQRNGFALSKEKRDELKIFQNKLSDLSITFSKNIADYQDFLIVSEADMDGLPEDYKNPRRQDDGSYKIDLSYPSYSAFMKSSPSEKARKAMYTKYSNRAADKNLEVLKEILVLRGHMATLLGYPSFAAYQIEERMAKTPKNVWAFEKGLMVKAKEKARRDYAELLDLKRKALNDPKVDVIQPWEKSFYEDLLLKERYSLDQEKVREYFELNNVISGLFQITQNLFGLEYTEVKDPSVWNDDVRLFEVKEGGKLIGRFYLDLYPRANKYNHAACFSMIKGKSTVNGYQLPMAALVCNFPEATDENPSLMYHSLGSASVETFFHEFGHVLHNMLTKAELFGYSGTSVARDFVEAPSQIFENWVWNYDALKLFAKHYKTGEVLPRELFDRMLAAKNAGSGLATLQQVYYGTLDMTLHDGYDPNGKETTTDVAKRLQNEITLYPFLDGTSWQAAFGHLTGYAAGYYGYLWAEVYAQDMFSVFQKNGIMDKKTGKRYRDIILARGGTQEPLGLVKEFLGREPNQEAYMKSIGL